MKDNEKIKLDMLIMQAKYIDVKYSFYRRIHTQ